MSKLEELNTLINEEGDAEGAVTLRWNIADVQALDNNYSDEDAKKFLERHSDNIASALEEGLYEEIKFFMDKYEEEHGE